MSLRRAASRGVRLLLVHHARASDAVAGLALQEARCLTAVAGHALSRATHHEQEQEQRWRDPWAGSFASRAFVHVTGPSQAAQPQPVPVTDASNGEHSQQEDKKRNPVQEAKPAVKMEQIPGAQLCDQALQGLKETRSRLAQRFAPHKGQMGYVRESIKSAWGLMASGYTASRDFVISVPGRVRGFLALSRQERREVYRGWWKTIKKEAKHYWTGTKLLAADVKIASRLVHKVLQGKALTRRERQQLTRTTADMFRLVPFAVFVLVPFMEFLLPVALRLFPNMLPSTFEDKLKKEEELKKKVSAKLEVARFLQETVQQMAKDMKSSRTGATQASAAELYSFMKRVRSGEPVSNYELMRFAQLFNDELTLDNLDRVHLVNLCRFVGISPFGTDAFLVSRLRTHLMNIKMDDRAIKEEGLDELSEDELRQACRQRGMRAPYGEGAVPFMKRQLAEWLDLSLNRALPSSLLLLSRAFTVTQPISKEGQSKIDDSLKDTISTLPNKVIEKISMEEAASGDDPARKLEYLRREEQLIQEEELEAAALLASDQPTLQPGQSAQEMTAAAAAAAVVREAAASATLDMLEGESEEEKAAKLAAAKEEKMRKVINALSILASSSGVSSERAAFMELVRKEVDRLNSHLAGGKGVSMVFQRGQIAVERPKELVEVVGHTRLTDKVASIIERIERDLDDIDEKIGERLHILDADNDGLISREELATALTFLRDHLGEDDLRLLLERLEGFGGSDGAIDVNRLMTMLAPEPARAVKAPELAK